MDYLKEFFEEQGTEKTFEAFEKWAKEKKLNIADLSKGDYVAKAKAERLAADKETAIKAEYEAKLKAVQEEMYKIKADAEAKSANLSETEKEKLEREKKLKDLEDKMEKASKKHEDAIKKLSEENEAAKQASLLAERKSLYIQAGGKQKNLDRDISFLSTLVTDEVNFETALETYKSDNPDVFSELKGSTIPDLKGGDKPTDTESLTDSERKRIGLEPKYNK